MKTFFSYTGSRYIELYFDSPRYASLKIQRKKNDPIPHRSSHSPSKSKYNRYSRSRSIFFSIRKFRLCYLIRILGESVD